MTAELERHLDQVRALSKPGQALALGAATATVNNRAWFVTVDGTPRPRSGRAALHQRLLLEARAKSSVEEERLAILLAGPPGLAGEAGHARHEGPRQGSADPRQGSVEAAAARPVEVT